MNSPDNGLLVQSVRRVFRLQLMVAAGLLVVVAVVSAAAGLAFAPALIACMYGSVLALVGTLLAARGVKRVSPDMTDGAGMAAIFVALLNKLVVVGGGIGFGLFALGLSPLWVVIGYLVVQLSPIWAIIQPGPVAGASR